jgi:hypothetical protein
MSFEKPESNQPSPLTPEEARLKELRAAYIDYSIEAIFWGLEGESGKEMLEETERRRGEIKTQIENSYGFKNNNVLSRKEDSDAISFKSEIFKLGEKIYKDKGQLEVFKSAYRLHSLTNFDPQGEGNFEGEAKKIVDKFSQNQNFKLAWDLIRILKPISPEGKSSK